MRLLAKLVLGTFLLFASKMAFSYNTTVYFGVDGHNCRTHFQNDFGGNLLKRDMQGGSPFFGLHLNRFLSSEVGFTYLKSSKTVSLPAGEYAAGNYICRMISPVTLKSSAIFKGAYLSLFVNSPKIETIPIQLFGGAGVSHTRAVFIRQTMQFDGIIGGLKRRIEATRTIPRVTGGINYFFNENLAVRGSITLVKTSKLRSLVNDGIFYGFECPEIRPKNSVIYSIGLRWSF